jgi:hypothetical protein
MPLTQLRTWARNIIRGRVSRPRRPGRPRLERLEERLTPDAVSWTGAGDGVSWGDARNWSSATRLPGPADDVTIDAPGTVVLHPSGTDSVRSLHGNTALLLSGGSLALASDSAIDNTVVLNGGALSAAGPLALGGLEQTAGTLSGAGTVTIQGQWDWSGGTQSGTGLTDLLGNADLSGSGASGPQLSGRVVDNDGTATLLAGSTLSFAVRAVWNNQSDSTFVLQDGGTLTQPLGSSLGQFINAGLLQVPGGPQGATVRIALTNSATGTVDVQAGTLFLDGNGSGSGTFDLEGTSTLTFRRGIFNLLDGAQTIDTGVVVVTSGGLAVAGRVSLPTLDINGGGVTLNAGAALDVGDLQLNGTLDGPGAVTVENDFRWTGGPLSGTGDTVLNGTSEISGGFFAQLNGRTVDNHGIATVAANNFFEFGFSGGAWNNHADGTLVLQSGSNVVNGAFGSAAVNNDGLVQAVGPGNSSVGVALNNGAGGTVDVEGGTLTLTTGGSSAGAFRVAAGAALGLGNRFALQDGATSTGEGDLRVNTASPVPVSGEVSLQNLTVTTGGVTVNAGGSLSTGSLTMTGGVVTVNAGASLTADNLTLAGAVLNVGGALTVNALEQTGGALTGAGTVTIQGQWDWSGGAQGGTGRTELLGSATLSGSGFFSTPQLSGRAVDNDGTATLLAGSTLAFGGGAAWNNQPDGTFVLQGGSSLGAPLTGGDNQFNNAGLLLLPGPQSATVNVVLNNAAGGVVDVVAGAPAFSGGGSSSGTFDLEGTSTLLLNAGAYTIQDGAASTGTGTLSVRTALTVSGNFSTAALAIDGGHLTVNAGASLDAQGLWLNGTLDGAGAVAVEGDFTWAGGTLTGSGSTVLNGTSEISGGQIAGRTVDNHGVATVLANSGFFFNAGGAWNNHADGTLVLQQGSSVGNFFADSAVLNNDGLVQMAGPGSATVGVALNNGAGGTVDVEGGTLTLAAGSSSGTFNAAAGTTLSLGNGFALQDGATGTGDGTVLVGGFNSASVSGAVNLQNLSVERGTLTVNAGASLTAGNLTLAGPLTIGAGASLTAGNLTLAGIATVDAGASLTADNLAVAGGGLTVNAGASLSAGSLTLTGGALIAGASLTVDSLTLAGGALTGAGAITVTGNFNWTGGTLGGTGQTFLEGASAISGSGFFSTPQLNGRTVNNDGVAAITGTGLDVQNDGVWNNDVGAVTVLTGSGVNAGPQAAFNNAGLLLTAGSGTVTISIPLLNADTGTVVVGPGTTLFRGGAFPAPFQTSGTVSIASGGTFFVSDYTQTGGATTVDGTLTARHDTVTPGSVFLNGGLLNGGGTINGNVVNAAELEPGDSPGTLTINGNYTQTSAGVLDIEIGGPAAGQYDRLVINGTASLAGTLNVVLLNGYVPGAGTSFGVLAFRSHTGDFDVENGLDLGGGLTLVPSFNAGDTGLSLVATQSS